MTEILWHGRGGQGAFTAARLAGCAYAMKSEDCYALAFPSFGPERRGAPIRAFTKLGNSGIGDRSEIEKADFSIFLDDTLYTESAFSELKEGGIIILNTKHDISRPGLYCIDADAIAVETLGIHITNTVMLGVLAAVMSGRDSEVITMGDIEKAVRLCLPAKIQDKNTAAAARAFEEAVSMKARRVQ